MKRTFLTLLFFSFLLSYAQEDKKTLRVNLLKDDLELVEKKVLKYENFQPGKLVLKDSTFFDVKLNYHQIYDQLIFINSKGDTLAVMQNENIAYAVIGTDSFYMFDKGFIRHLGFYGGHSLSVKRFLKYIGKENKGPYGSYSAVSSVVTPADMFISDGDLQRKLIADEQQLFVYNVQYFISDRFLNFFPASKKNIFNIFSKNDKELQEYFKSNKVDVNKKEDMENLLIFLQGL